MIRQVADRLVVELPMNQETATGLLAAGKALLVEGGVTLFDLAEVTEADSSALALLFAWQRAAKLKGGSVRIAHPPASLLSLAELYDLTDLLPLQV